MASPLNCPACREQMLEIDDGGVKVDQCLGCLGLWFDAGELETRGVRLGKLVERRPGGRDCPRCSEPMEIVSAQLVELDCCPRCQGLFLDAGELKLLLDAGRSVAPASIDGSVVSADRGEPRAKPPPARPSAFRCDLCHQFRPIHRRVIGEHATACDECAAQHGIRHDPGARRQAVRRRVLQHANTATGVPQRERSLLTADPVATVDLASAALQFLTELILD
jgi:Zn-finger nucleic acid-binding protein